MDAPFARFKTEEPHDFWISGFSVPITGTIEEIEFYEDEETGEVTTYLVIASETKLHRVNLKSISAWAEQIKDAA